MLVTKAALNWHPVFLRTLKKLNSWPTPQTHPPSSAKTSPPGTALEVGQGKEGDGDVQKQTTALSEVCSVRGGGCKQYNVIFSIYNCLKDKILDVSPAAAPTWEFHQPQWIPMTPPNLKED